MISPNGKEIQRCSALRWKKKNITQLILYKYTIPALYFSAIVFLFKFFVLEKRDSCYENAAFFDEFTPITFDLLFH